MKLDDFLKIKKVRCIDTDNYKDLTIGKEYEVAGVDNDDTVKIIDDYDYSYWYNTKLFEPVLDSENPLQGVELTPEFEAVEPRFKVGDPVYWGLKSRIFKVCLLMTANVLEVELDDVVIAVHKDELCPATLENYGKLCSLFERIDFEQPRKELKGSDLCFEKLRNGKKLVMCAVSDLSDEKAIKRLEDDDGCIRIIKDCDPSPYHFIDTHGIRHGFAVPLNDETGYPLTQAVLDE